MLLGMASEYMPCKTEEMEIWKYALQLYIHP